METCATKDTKRNIVKTSSWIQERMWNLIIKGRGKHAVNNKL